MQGVFTKFLQLWIPNKTDKGSVVTDVFEPNFTKLDQNAETTNETLTDLGNNKLDKGTYSGKASDLKTGIDGNTEKILGSLGKNYGNFPLSSATKNNVYYLPSNNKFYICIADYSGGLISVPNANFEELSIYTNRLITNRMKEYYVDIATYGTSDKPNFLSLVFTRMGNKVFVNGMIYPDSNAEYGYANLIPANFRPSENKTLYYWTLNTGVTQASSGSALFYPDGTILLKNPILSREKQSLISGFYAL